MLRDLAQGLSAAAASVVALATLLCAQVPPIASFDVASVKESSTDSRAGVDVIPGRFTATHVTLRELIKLAYPIADRVRNDGQVVGGPDWTSSLRFDVVATGAPRAVQRPAPGAVAPPESAALNDLRSMLQALLADRFSLAVHHESRELPILALTRVHPDRLGPELRPAADCANGSGPPEATDRPACGGFRLSAAGVSARAVTIPMLVSLLSNLPATGRAVEDRTGLSGRFDLELTWVHESPPLEPGHVDSGATPAGPSLFTAVQEQLGLKLEPARAPVDVLVIDRAERPSPN